MFGMKPEGFPDTSNLDEMKDKSIQMKFNTLAGFLEDVAHCRIPMKLLIDNEPLVERFIGKKRRRDEEEIYDFVRYLKKTYGRPSLEERQAEENGDEETAKSLKLARETMLEAPLWPPEEKFWCDYAHVDYEEVKKEKEAVKAFVIKQQQEMAGHGGGLHAPISADDFPGFGEGESN